MRRPLLILAIIALASNLASADPSSAPTAVSYIETQLVRPLAVKERDQSKFSRARLPPAKRRVRVTDEKPQLDSTGEAFVTFAIDARTGWSDENEAAWNKAAIVGCVYTARGEVFIKRGNAFHPAAAALGKRTRPAPATICHAATS